MGDWRRWTPESVESIGGNVNQYTAEQGAPQTLMEQMVDVLGCIDRIYRTLGHHDVQSLQDELINRLGDKSCATLDATILAAQEAARIAKEELLHLNRQIEATCQNAGRVQYAEGEPVKVYSQMLRCAGKAQMAEVKENIVSDLKKQPIS